MKQVLAIVALTLWAGGVWAQEPPSPAQPAEEAAVQEKPAEPPAVPTVEEMMERIRGLLGMANPMVSAGEAVVATGAEIRRGDVIVAVPVQPRRVGRLENDLLAAGGWLTRERLLLPAGTPVYQTRFTYRVTSNYGVVITSRDYEAWCGVVADNEARRPRQRGYCALQSRGKHDAGEVTGGSPYMGRTLIGPFAANEVAINEDPAVVAEFPRMELIYTFVEFDENDADVRRGVRVDGGEVIELNNVSLARQTDGASLLRAAGGEIRIVRTDNRRTARIEVVRAPRAFDPDEEEAQLRQLAGRLVEAARRRAAAAAAGPGASAPAAAGGAATATEEQPAPTP